MPPVTLSEPASILHHVVDPTKVSVMATRAPHVVAATDMYRRQIEMIRDLVRIGHSYQIGPPAGPSFSYTTYEQTKEYIAKNRPPALTMKDALKQVHDESYI